MELTEKNKNEKLIKYLSIFTGITLLVVLIIVKVNSPAFKFLPFVLAIIGLIVFFGGIIFISRLLDRKKIKSAETSEEKLPKAITYEQAREIAKAATKNPDYAEYINGCLGETVEQLGSGVKSSIYCYKAQGYYRGNTIYVLINMHYPREKKTILIDPTPFELEKAKMSLSMNPAAEPSTRIIKRRNPLLGTEEEETEVIREKEKTDDESDKKEVKRL